MIRTLLLFLAIIVSIQCWDDASTEMDPPVVVIRGVTMVAPPEPFPADPIRPIKEVNANWVAVIPYAYSPKDEPKVIFGNKWQWWGEKEEGIRESIRLAKEGNLSVMVKPQVYIHGSWVGAVDFDSESDWQHWEKDYEKYILRFAEIAAEGNADMFCIGTEYKISIQKREAFWRALIQKVGSIFKGTIIYSANWDSYANVPFWDAVDYIGISSYFPLTSSKTPDVQELKTAWRPIVKKLDRFAKEKNKHIIFTEFGYLTVDHCAFKAWELEPMIPDLEINQQAQANAFEALFAVFWEQNFWAGGFIWKWFPNMRGHEGYPDKDYTPQGKLSENVISEWYAEEK